MKETYLIVLCTAGSIEEAKKISYTLIEKKLAACCSILPEIISIYPWEKKVEEKKEILLVIKTLEKNYETLEKEIKMIHSYTIPEIIAINIDNGSKAYLDWVKEYTEKGEI